MVHMILFSAGALIGFLVVGMPPVCSASNYGYGPSYASGPAKYNFDWAVNDAASGNDYGHQESRDGDYTQGSYYVLLPDGRTQKVNYNINGDSGFVADVTYAGTVKPYYGPPRPHYVAHRPTYGRK